MLGFRYLKKCRSKKSQETDPDGQTGHSSSSYLAERVPTSAASEAEKGVEPANTTSPTAPRDSAASLPSTPAPNAEPVPYTPKSRSPSELYSGHSSNTRPSKSRSLSIGKTVISISRRTSDSTALGSRASAIPATNVPSQSESGRKSTPVSSLQTPAEQTLQQTSVVRETSEQQSSSSYFPTTPTPTRESTGTTQLPIMMSPRILSQSGYGNLNGSNGVFSPPQSPNGAFRSKGRHASFTSSRPTSGNFSAIKSFNKRASGAPGYKIGFVQESANALRKKSVAELGSGIYQGVAGVSYVNLLEWIRAERLTTLPHKGSRWDKVLIRALYFAEQLHKFDQVIQAYAVDSSAAAAIGYGHAQLLLGLGFENSSALDKAFAVFYKFSFSFSKVLHRAELLAATSEVREQLCLLYTDLLSLVVDVAIRFYKTANGMTSGSVSLDILELFGETIEAFRTRQNTVVELIWDSQIQGEDFEEDEELDLKVLSRWLSPQDHVLATLNRDHSFFVDQQVEFTCIWFQKHLSRFLQSDKNLFLITGQPGAGKTTLAGSIVERLQRPVNRKQVDTLFCSLSPDVPTSATSLAVVKSLLLQLLNIRVGNMSMYYALLRAYQSCRTSADLKTYEGHLWQALADTLKHPIEGGNDLIMVVDGLDEIAESQSASIQAAGAISPSAILEKLAKITNESRGVRLITLSSSLKLPSHLNGIQHQVTREDVRDDLHAVALRALVHNKHFQSKPASEQETFIDNIIQAANGSFLWTVLVCENLNSQKSSDAVTKTLTSLQSAKPTVQDLVLKLFTSLDITNNAKTALSWIMAAERPLTISEIHTLFTVDTARGTLSDKGVDVQATIQTLKPFLTLHEHIVRFRHPIIHTALHNFAKQSKIPIHLQESETDLLLRVLTYAKTTLRDKGEPVINNQDPTISDRLFRQHHFLEYTVRYWVLHLQQSPLAPKTSGEFKPTAELQRALPETTVLPILEQLVWDTQLPIPEAIDLHKLVGTVRRTVFTDNHPSVLQTYFAVATSYLLIDKPTEAQKYFYLCAKISRTILSDVHPLTLECATQYLKITESMVTKTRTEITTHREEILVMLISSYERQYGSTSELVIQTRKLLVELYASIDEEDRAMEVYRLIQGATIQQYGRNSHQAQDVQGHLSVVLGKRRDSTMDGYKESFFHEDDHVEDETVEVFDVASIVAYLRRAEQYTSRKELSLAEQTYVELWQEVSSKCRSSQSVEWHEKNIEVATSYSQFLKTQKRVSEATSILTCVWQQYEHHQLSYSEKIVAQLTHVAKEMKSTGSYTQALSIFRHASSFYKNVRQEETHTSREVNKEVSETSTELVKQSLSNSSTTTETTTVSESVYQDVFFSVIKSSKTLESSTVALAKKLTTRYMEQRNWSAAINVIQTTLQRTWSSFMSSSIQDVTLTSTFTQESVELVEKLAECYLHTQQLEKVEDTYKRFWQAVSVTQNVDKTIFEKAKTLLITFYDKHGYADSAISVYQDILVSYRTKLGPAHELTIQILYDLARRCQKHPRNHPYWIEYYLQIITTLNKDSDVCHKDALDAMIIVTETYWQDRRYAEAVTLYRVLWNTYTRKTKEYKIFSQETFVRNVYEHYYQCLEETKASWKSLHQVTKEYRETSITAFGAESAVAVEATLALAQISQRSEEHISQAISLYEEASRSKTTTTTRVTVSEMKQALSSLYVRQLQTSSSSNFKSETVQRAIGITQDQLTESISKYGYSHESSLTRVKELAMLYQRQQKTDVAVRSLTTAASEIISKESSSQKQIESAASVASSFHAIEQTSVAHRFIEELHRQIIAKDSRSASKWSFDLTKSSRSALAFLASLQYNLRSDLSITFGEIMADLTLEYIYFEQFRKSLANNEHLKKILLTAAPLRYFLRRNKQQDMIAVVEDQAVGLFVKRDASDLHTLSKESPRIFIIAILDHLGNGRNKDFDRSVIMASNDSVSELTKAKKFAEAYDIANLGFMYASKYNGYNGPRSISLGFKLASLLVGRDGEKCPDAALRKKMLELSNKIVRKILDISKQLNINFAQVQLYELSHLSALLGEQQDYETLEWLLKTLWNTRDAQRSWPADVLLNLGRRLICARYLAGHPIKAIRLCEDIAYNMRRAHGPRAPVTIETYELLAQLYTSTAQTYQAKAASEKTGPLAQEYFKKAINVHEDLLRLVMHEHGSGGGDDSDDEIDTAAYLLAKEGVSVSSHDVKQTDSQHEGTIDRSATALRHLHLLKLAYQRLGGWPKPYEEYEHLNAEIFREFGSDPKWKGVRGTETWDAKSFGSGKAESQEGAFVGIEDWGLGKDDALLHTHAESNGNGVANGANGHGFGNGNGVHGLGLGKARAHHQQAAVAAF